MKTFTKIFFVVTLISSHLLSFAADRGGIRTTDAEEGVEPVSKGTAVWKLAPEKRSELVVSAQNSRPSFVADINVHTCSKLYASSVSDEFHSAETAYAGRGVYSAISFASYMPSREIIRQVPSISAYPNPSRGATRLSLTQIGGDNYKIKVSNTIGKVMRTFELPPMPDNTTVVLDMDMSVYPAGIYF